MENSIEEDIKKAEELIKKCDKCKLTECINCEISWTEIASIRRIIDNYRNVLKENEELKNQEETARKVNELLVERYSTSISVQKVKDKIRKNEEIIDISNDGDLIHELLQKNKVYEELLESEE